jgi:hypothetical protein
MALYWEDWDRRMVSLADHTGVTSVHWDSSVGGPTLRFCGRADPAIDDREFSVVDAANCLPDKSKRVLLIGR